MSIRYSWLTTNLIAIAVCQPHMQSSAKVTSSKQKISLYANSALGCTELLPDGNAKKYTAYFPFTKIKEDLKMSSKLLRDSILSTSTIPAAGPCKVIKADGTTSEIQAFESDFNYGLSTVTKIGGKPKTKEED